MAAYSGIDVDPTRPRCRVATAVARSDIVKQKRGRKKAGHVWQSVGRNNFILSFVLYFWFCGAPSLVVAVMAVYFGSSSHCHWPPNAHVGRLVTPSCNRVRGRKRPSFFSAFDINVTSLSFAWVSFFFIIFIIISRRRLGRKKKLCRMIVSWWCCNLILIPPPSYTIDSIIYCTFSSISLS